MDDQLCKDILCCYTSADRKYPDAIYALPPDKRANPKSHFRRVEKPYRAEGGMLYHDSKHVVRKSQVNDTLSACHNNPVSGSHFGCDKTLAKISE